MRVDIDVDSNPNTGQGGKDVSVSVRTDLFLNGVLNPHLLATYDRWCAAFPAARAWQKTRRDWLAYAEAIQAGRLPASWWFPAADIPIVLDRLAPRGVPPSTATRSTP